MAALRTATRALHTSRRVLADAAATPTPAGKPGRAEKLGFTFQKRQRKLPTLSVPAGARRNMDGTQPTALTPNDSQVPPAAGMDNADIPLEFFEGAELARLPKKNNNNRRDGNREGDRNRNRDGNRNDRRDGNRDGKRFDRFDRKRSEAKAGTSTGSAKPSLPRLPRSGPLQRPERITRSDVLAAQGVPLPQKYDASPRALFGGRSLLAPRRQGAQDAAGSFWAKEMDAAEARKADLRRIAGAYDVLVPAGPRKGAVPSAAWLLAMNASVSQRRAAAALDGLKSYVK